MNRPKIEGRETSQARKVFQILSESFLEDSFQSINYLQVLSSFCKATKGGSFNSDILNRNVLSASDIREIHPLWMELQQFIYHWWVRKSQEIELEERIKIIIKLILTSPQLGLCRNPSFDSLFNRRSISSHATKGQLSRLLLKSNIEKRVVYREIDDEWFMIEANKFLEGALIQYTGNQDPSDAGLMLDHITFGHCFTIAEPPMKLSEANISKWVLNYYIKPVKQLVQTFTSNHQLAADLQFHGIYKVKSDGKADEATLSVYTDVFIAQHRNYVIDRPICCVELKTMNIQSLIDDFDGKYFGNYLLQMVSQMLSLNTIHGILTDGVNLLFIGIDLDSPRFNSFINSPKSERLPLTYKRITFTAGGVTMKTLLLSIFYKQNRLSETEQLHQDKNLEKLKPCILKSRRDFIQALKLFCDENYIKSHNFPSLKINGSNLSDVNSDLNSFDPSSSPRVLQINKKSAREKLDVLVGGHGNELLFLVVYDPIRNLIHLGNGEEENFIDETINMFEKMYQIQIESYETTREFNARCEAGEDQINIPTIYHRGNIKLEITNSDNYICGPYFVCEYIKSRPKLEKHFQKGIRQLELMKKAQIFIDSLTEKDLFYEQEKFFLTNFTGSTFQDEETKGQFDAFEEVKDSLLDTPKSKKQKRG